LKEYPHSAKHRLSALPIFKSNPCKEMHGHRHIIRTNHPIFDKAFSILFNGGLAVHFDKRQVSRARFGRQDHFAFLTAKTRLIIKHVMQRSYQSTHASGLALEKSCQHGLKFLSLPKIII